MASRVLLNENAVKSIVPSLRKCIWMNRAQAAGQSRTMVTAAARNSPSKENNAADVDRRGRGVPTSRRTDLNTLFNDGWDPFFPPRSLGQALDAASAFFDNPLVRVQQGGTQGSLRKPWDAKEDDDAFRLRLDVPGFGKEDVKVHVEDNTLIIKGQVREEGESDERKISSRIELPKDLYKASDIKAELKNGVLRVTVPKIKREELKKVVEVKVD